MIPGNCNFFKRILTGLIFFSSSCLAFSSTPPAESTTYQARDWQSGNSATDDAHYAIENDDLRFLAFAGRGFRIPGITDDAEKNYRDKCGVRYFKEFSDVMRNKTEHEQRRQAAVYAQQYNGIILENCKALKR